jgi:hypothetical protein
MVGHRYNVAKVYWGEPRQFLRSPPYHPTKAGRTRSLRRCEWDVAVLTPTPNLSKVEWAIGYLGIATIKGRVHQGTRRDVEFFEDPDPSRWSFEATIEGGQPLFSGL